MDQKDTARSQRFRRTEVFISAASRDLKSTRRIAKEAVDSIGCHGVYQEEFPPDYRKVEEMLRHRLSACDAVVHIVGRCFGSEPTPDETRPRRSYTQIEYDIAKELNLPLYVFVCSEQYPYDAHEEEPEELLLLQKAHRADCLERPEIREKVDSAEQLKLRLSQLEDHLRKLEQEVYETRQTLSQHQQTLSGIETGVRRIEESEKGRGARTLGFVILCLGYLFVMALFLVGAADAWAGKGQLDMPQLVCLSVAGLLLLAFVFRPRWVFVLLATTPVLASLVMGAAEPLMQESPYYLALSPAGHSWNWETRSCKIHDKSIRLVAIQDPIRRRLAPWLAEKIKSPYRMLPVLRHESGFFADLPLKGRMEGSYHDGIVHWESLRITMHQPCLVINYDKSGEGFTGTIGMRTENELVDVSQPQGYGMVPWKWVKLPDAGDRQVDGLFYAVVLNESLEGAMALEKHDFCPMLLGLIDRRGFKGDVPYPPSDLEMARVMALRIGISDLLWKDPIGALHSLPFVGATLDIFRKHVLDGRNTANDMTSRWILGILKKKLSDEGAAEHLKELEGWEVSRSFSNEVWTSIHDDREIQAIKDFAGSIGFEPEKIDLESDEPAARSYFEWLEDKWKNLPVDEVVRLVDSKNLSASDQRYLARHLCLRLVMPDKGSAVGVIGDDRKLVLRVLAKYLGDHPNRFPGPELKALEFIVAMYEQFNDLAGNGGDGMEKFMASAYFVTPFLKRIFESEEDTGDKEMPVLLDEDLDFSDEWWSDSFMGSFANLVSMNRFVRQPNEEVIKVSPRLASFAARLKRADADGRALDFFSRDCDGAGNFNVPWLIYWQSAARELGAASAEKLDIICRDITRQAYGKSGERGCSKFRDRIVIQEKSKYFSDLRFAADQVITITGLPADEVILLEDFIRRTLRDDEAGKPSNLKVLIQKYYVNQGYLRCEEPLISIVKKGENLYSISINMKGRGLRYKIGTIGFKGNKIFPTEQLLTKLKTKAGEYYIGSEVISSLAAVRKVYMDQGYVRVTVNLDIADDGAESVSLNLLIEEGSQVTLGALAFEGNLPWGENELRDMATFRVGDVLNHGAVEEWIAAIKNHYSINGFPGCEVTFGFERSREADVVKLNVLISP